MKPRIESAISGQGGVALGQRTAAGAGAQTHQAYLRCRQLPGVRPAAGGRLDAFLKSPTAIIGNGDTCVLPPAPASIFHHEPELAFVVGKTATNVSQDEALDYVFGYTNFLDMSARESPERWATASSWASAGTPSRPWVRRW